jgi:hypothetical protein
MKHLYLPLSALLLVVSLLGGYPAPGQVQATPTELFFSEYVEGSSNNRALEIYNGTGSAVDLAAGSYNVQMFFNGSASAGLAINLTGTVANGDVYVIAHVSAIQTILDQADQTSAATWYNGDDAVVLRKGTAIIDVIGQTGFDPGSEWGTDLTGTMDNTLRRKAAIQAGDTVDIDVFDPAIEWDGFATDTIDGLGSHTIGYQASVFLPLIFKMTSQVLSGVYVLDNHTTYTSGSNLHIVGEVFNNTPKIVNDVKISVNFFNSGQLVENGYSYADLRILHPYEKTCFNITLQDNPAWNQYLFEPVSYSNEPQSTRPLITAVTHSGGVFITYYYRIKGQVRNDEAVTVVYPRIYATLYNSLGKVILCGAVSALEYTLSPGQMSDFSLTTIPANPNEVESYSLQTTGNFPESSSEKYERVPRE